MTYEDQFYIRYTKKVRAIQDAAQALYLLNRFCKNKRLCSYEQKEEIYHLKSQFINYLYDAGYCTKTFAQEVNLPDCAHCLNQPPKDTICSKCGRDAKKQNQFYVFRFKIGAKSYQWHQPVHQFPHSIEVEKKLAPMNKLKARDIHLKTEAVTEKMALLRWVLTIA